MTAQQVREAMLLQGVKRASFLFEDGESYDYIDLGGGEYQYGREGDIITNYSDKNQAKQDSQIKKAHFKMYDDCNCTICKP